MLIGHDLWKLIGDDYSRAMQKLRWNLTIYTSAIMDVKALLRKHKIGAQAVNITP